jgi:hypothetical protein
MKRRLKEAPPKGSDQVALHRRIDESLNHMSTHRVIIQILPFNCLTTNTPPITEGGQKLDVIEDHLMTPDHLHY